MVPGVRALKLQKTLHAAGLRHVLARGVLLAKGPKLCLDEVIPECLPDLRSGGMLWLRLRSRLGTYQQPQRLSLQTEETHMGTLAHRNSSLPCKGWRPRAGEHRQLSGDLSGHAELCPSPDGPFLQQWSNPRINQTLARSRKKQAHQTTSPSFQLTRL